MLPPNEHAKRTTETNTRLIIHGNEPRPPRGCLRPQPRATRCAGSGRPGSPGLAGQDHHAPLARRAFCSPTRPKTRCAPVTRACAPSRRPAPIRPAPPSAMPIRSRPARGPCGPAARAGGSSRRPAASRTRNPGPARRPAPNARGAAFVLPGKLRPHPLLHGKLRARPRLSRCPVGSSAGPRAQPRGHRRPGQYRLAHLQREPPDFRLLPATTATATTR